MERLNRAWDALATDAGADERSLEPTAAETLRTLQALDDAPAPEAAFAERLWQQLTDGAAATDGTSDTASARTVRRQRWRLAASAGWRPLAGLATAAVLVLGFVGLALWASRPQPVSAAEVVRRAQAVAERLSAAGVQSFELVEVTRSRPANAGRNAMDGLTGREEIRSEQHRWYQAPHRWRVENRGTVVDEAGHELPDRAWSLISVSDGTDVWQYDERQSAVTINRLEEGLDEAGATPFGEPASDLSQVLQQASTCYDPRLRGEEQVAGRLAYVIDLGPTRCPSASGPEYNGRRVIWVDKETFFVLKDVLHHTTEETVLVTREVTSVRYDVPLDPALFAFTPPPEAVLRDFRPKPAPSAEQYQRQLAELAGQVEFPLFAPRQVPAGLVPRQPRLEPGQDARVELAYVPAEQAETDSPAGAQGFQVVQQRATDAVVARWTEGAEPIEIGGRQSWLRRGERQPDGTGTDSAALLVRDGTLMSVASFALSPEALIEVAASLEPVPGGHAPLPNPTPPTLADIRQRVSFPVFVPTWLPPGLTPEPPVGGELPTQNVEIRYHTADGAVGLVVRNGGLDCCPGFARLPSERVTLPNGLEGHLIRTPTDRYGGLTLWWQQDGATISLSGPAASEGDLIKIAASMSNTADLGQTEAPPARPTATPLPAPSFTILRPTWLPEEMVVREQRVPNPHGPGVGVVLTFDPRPDDQPHDLLTLRELPAGESQPEIRDPQVTTEEINGRQVTIVRRGEGCVTASWVQGEVALQLTNPYDPPGPPGAVRYSCNELRRVVASIR